MQIQYELVYRCAYCNKAMLSKGAMTLHERMCKKNPKNQHKCFKYCKWLIKNKNVEDGFSEFDCTNPNCGYYNKGLYSYKLERNSTFKDRVKEDNLIRMPLMCKHYEIESGHDEKYINNIK